MAHTASPSSSSFSAFLLGVVLTLVVVSALALWSGSRPIVRTAALDRPVVSIPLPRLPPPPGVVPKAEAHATH